MNNFMQQYNIELQRLQNEYSKGMSELQQNLNNYRQFQTQAPQVQQQQTQQEIPPVFAQILGVLGEIKVLLTPKDEDKQVETDSQPSRIDSQPSTKKEQPCTESKKK